MRNRVFALLSLATALCLGVSLPLQAQGAHFLDRAQTTTGSAVPGASVRVCTEPATGTACTPLATLYADVTLSTPLSNPTVADANGNISFYVSPGLYHIQVSAANLTQSDVANVVLIGGGTNGFFSGLTLTLAEGSCTGAKAGWDVLCADATLHTFKSSLNNGSFVAIPQLAGDLGNTAASPQVLSTHLSAPLPIAQGGTAQATANYTAAFGAGPSYAGVSYATLTACYAAIASSGGACFVGANQANGTYTETLAAGIAFTKPNSGFVFTVPYAITMGSNVITNASGIDGTFIRSFPGRGSGSAPSGKWVYTGTGIAMTFGDSSGDISGLRLENFQIVTTGAGAAASPIKLVRVDRAHIENISAFGPSGATTQVGGVIDGSAVCACNNTLIGNKFQGYATNFTLQNDANANALINTDVSLAGTGGTGLSLNGTVGQVAENIFTGLLTESSATGISGTGSAVGNQLFGVENDSGITTDVNFGASTARNEVHLMLPTAGVTDTGTNNTVIDPSTYKLTSGGAMTLGIAASSPGTLSLAKGAGGGALFTIASGATTPWTMTSKATAPAQGDLQTFSNATGQMATVADVATGQVLVSGGANAVPAYSANPSVTTVSLTGTAGVINDGAAHVWGKTFKKGTGAGNYTTASTTFVVPDATNLCYTVTIPTGWKLHVTASGNASSLTAVVQISFAITDNASCSTANAGILITRPLIPTSISNGASDFFLDYVITGDGAAHNVALQFETTNAADSASILNNSSTNVPTMVFELVPSN